MSLNVVHWHTISSLWLKTILIALIGTVSMLLPAQTYHLRPFPDQDQYDLGQISSLLTDQMGFQWIGTDNGLYRFNGAALEKMTVETGIQDYYAVVDMALDQKGDIWLSLRYKGVFTWSYATGSFHKVAPTTSSTINLKQVNNIEVDQKGNIWFATFTGSIGKYDPSAKQITQIDNRIIPDTSARRFINTIHIDQASQLWVSTSKSLLRYDITTNQYYASKTDSLLGELSKYEVNCILSNGTGGLWLGTSGNGLLYSDTKTGLIRRFRKEDSFGINLPTNDISSLYFDKKGNLWIGTNGNGLIALEGAIAFNGRNSLNPILLQGNRRQKVSSIVEDDFGNIWIGQKNGEIETLSFDQSGIAVRGLNFGSDRKKVTSLSWSPYAQLLVGSNEGDIRMFGFDQTNTNFIPRGGSFSSLVDVKVLQRDARGNIWIATQNDGIHVLPPQGESIPLKNHPETGASLGDVVYDLILSREGYIWTTTNKGVFVFSPDLQIVQSFRAEDIASKCYFFNTLHQDNLGRIWLGSISCGLFQIQKDRRVAPIPLAKESSCGFGIKQIRSDDKKNSLWVSTPANCLMEITAAGEILQQVDVSKQLAGNEFQSFEVDQEGHVWISTNNAIFRWNIVDRKADRFMSKEALQTNDFVENASTISPDGILFFGTRKGLLALDPASLRLPTHKPKIYITNLEVIGKEADLSTSIEITEAINLKYFHHNFTIGFSGLNGQLGNQLQYFYRLLPDNDDWIALESRQHKLSLTNIPSGKYVFELKAIGEGSRLESETKSLSIHIATAPWKTPLAITGYVLLGFILLGLSYWYLYHWLRLKNQLALEQVSREKEKEIHELKINFFTKVTHELRTPLSLILGPLNTLTEGKYEDPKIPYFLKVARANAYRLLRLTNQIMNLRKKETGKLILQASQEDIVKFSTDIVENFQDLAQQKNVQLRLINHTSNTKLWFDPEKLEHILYNLLSNAIKFSESGKEVILTLEEVEQGRKKAMRILVADSGKGIPDLEKARIFDMFYQEKHERTKLTGFGVGLALAKELVALHHGTIEVKDNKPKGTIFVVTLPMGAQHLREDEKLNGVSTQHQLPNLSLELSPAEIQTNQPQPASRKTLLVVEDNYDLRQFMVKLFEGEFNILTASNGRQGLTLAQAKKPDIIVSDVLMPEMDGLELTTAIKEDHKLSHIPIILLTARTSELMKLEGLSIGANDYLPKPFNATTLRIKVRNLLEQKERMLQEARTQLVLSQTSSEQEEFEDADQVFKEKLMTAIEEKMSEPDFKVDVLAKEMFMSHSSLYRKCIAVTGQTLVDLVRFIRLKKAAEMLSQTSNKNITDIAYEVGFNDVKYFRRCFKQQFGKTPSQFRSIPNNP